MKFIFLVSAGLWRKPVRTLLTALSIVVAFTLFGLLQGVDTAFGSAIEQARLDRMFVDPRFPGTPLPRTYFEQVQAVPGVELITEVSAMFGFIREPNNGVLVINTRPDVWLSVWSEWQYDDAEVEYVMRNRQAVMISDALAAQHGLGIGDRVTVQSRVMKTDGTADWTYEIAGIMSNPEQPDARNYFVLANWPYFDEARAAGNGTVGRFLMRIEDPSRTSQVARAIDALFANSSSPTKTQSEQSMAESRVTDIGDVKFFTRSIIGAVFFALLLLTANTMMQSVRERTAELGVLKSLGFPGWGLFALVLAEAVLLFVVAAALGLVVSSLIFPLFSNYLVITNASASTVPPAVVSLGLLLAVTAAIVSAAVPAWRAHRLSATAALAEQ